MVEEGCSQGADGPGAEWRGEAGRAGSWLGRGWPGRGRGWGRAGGRGSPRGRELELRKLLPYCVYIELCYVG